MWPDSVLDPGQAGLILVVDKTAQELRIYRSDGQGNLRLEKTVPCSTGMIKGDKLIRGDKKTPEGYYIFRQKLLPEELPDIYGILAYPMDYPNFWDQKSGRGGDGIWTHGVNKPLVDYDSNGCIELLNHDLAALEDSIRLYDTPILVAEQLRLVPAEDQKKEASQVLEFLESWRAAWSSKNLPAYRRHYDSRFVNSENRTFEGWMEQKRHIASLYNQISVQLEDIRIFWHRDVILVSFVQRYKGDNRFSSSGFKRLYLAKTPYGFQILAEEFASLPDPPPVKKLSFDQKQAALTTPPLAVASVAAPIAVASAGALSAETPQAPLTGSETIQAASNQEAANEESARAALERGAETRSAQGIQPRESAAAAAGESDGPAPRAGESAGAVETPQIQPAAGGETQTAGPSAGNFSSGSDLVPDIKVAEVETPLQRPTEILTPPSPAVSATDGQPAASQGSGSGLNGAIGPGLSEYPWSSAAPGQVAADRESEVRAEPGPVSASGSAPAPQTVRTQTPGTPETAEPSASPPSAAVSPNDSGPDEELLKVVVAGWLAAWNARDQAGYFSFYAPDFYFPEKNIHLASFKKYRGRMMGQAKTLSVSAENVRIKASGDKATVVFTQNYKSDRTKDRGEKILDFRLQDGQWQILREVWRELP
jgi:murein L,D-transpeptidase YafK